MEPPHFDATIALADYYAPLDTLALDLKFHTRLATADEFARQLQAAFETTDAAAPDVIAPVPLSHWRLRSRGYKPRRGRSANRLRAGLARWLTQRRSSGLAIRRRKRSSISIRGAAM